MKTMKTLISEMTPKQLQKFKIIVSHIDTNPTYKINIGHRKTLQKLIRKEAQYRAKQKYHKSIRKGVIRLAAKAD